MDRIRVGVIGAGRIGSMHIQHLVAHPRFQLGAIADPRSDALEEVAAQGVPVFTDWTELLAESRLDAVVIASATEAHAGQVEAALEEGLAIFCEKPLAEDVLSFRETSLTVRVARHP